MWQGIGQRGGNRGGKDQFNWDDVRGDKYKEFYLGQSGAINVGNWWNRGIGLYNIEKNLKDKKSEQQVAADEMARVKQEEQELMMEALGLKPKRRRDVGKQLEKHEFKELCRRGTTERDESDVNRVGGLGFAPAARVRPDGIEIGAPMPATERSETGDNFVPADNGNSDEELTERRQRHDSDDEGSKPKEKKQKKEKKDKKHKKEKKDKKERKEKRKHDDRGLKASEKASEKTDDYKRHRRDDYDRRDRDDNDRRARDDRSYSRDDRGSRRER